MDPKKRAKPAVSQDHPLWQFFGAERAPFRTPEDLDAHGRAWTVEELRRKDFYDLHKLWWICVKERNRLSTEANELERTSAGYGMYEVDERMKTVRLRSLLLGDFNDIVTAGFRL